MNHDPQYRYVAINDDVSVPVPILASREEEDKIVARFKEENPPEKLAAELEEWKQILRDFEEGKLIDLEVVLEEMSSDTSPSIQPDHVIERRKSHD